MAGTRLPQALQFTESGGIVFRRPPIPALVLEKRNDPTIHEVRFVSPLVVVDQNERAAAGNDLQDFGCRPPQLFCPPRRARNARCWSLRCRHRFLSHFHQMNHLGRHFF